ncbi:MAG: type II toxin-antitoxin system prevent-host-death family antitoxin [Alphaproteobacteria bacterium]|nr:type II toxin-antitoxin system prevent-host-death family antitoxin [Alphaproteobacteria bacterium]
MTKHVGIFEAKTQLSALVDAVEKGEDIVITRHGKPVARLTRPEDRHSPEAVAQRRKAIAELREMARKRGLRATHEEIKSWIEEGRR